jgi:phthiodiolone/phenolphthiodiolone dimycocerosates ketoreductase
VLTIGAPASLYPSADPLDDVRWADANEDIAGVWFIDHLQGWAPRGIETGTIEDPHRLLDPFSLMAAVAAETSRVPIGVSVTDPLRRSPVALLQAALTIGWLCGRPMVLGLGTGVHENQAPYGLERAGPARYLTAACETISTLRADAEIHRGGLEPWPRDGAVMGMSAVSELRLWVAAHQPRALEAAARYGDGWLPSSLSPRTYAEKLSTVRTLSERYGRDPGAIRPAMFTWAVLAGSREESERLLEEPLIRAAALYRGQRAFARHGAAHPLGDDDPPRYLPTHIEPGRAQAVIEQIPTALVADSVLTGSLEEVEERLGAYEEAGMEHLIVYDIGRYVGDDGVARSRDCLARLARGRAGSVAA